MAKERLSRLQKWILARCLKNKIIYRNEVKKYYGKEFPGLYRNKIIWYWNMGRYRNKKNMFEKYEGLVFMWTYDEESGIGEQKHRIKNYYKVKEEFIIKRWEETDISRSINNLIKRGILIQTEEPARGLKLTAEGLLKANKLGVRKVSTTMPKMALSR
ncbi:MAG: hypothetical protein M1308_08025 [Actinobacteria bacterium]|nr:hypothetical protein [Actinomycetota bacterium]